VCVFTKLFKTYSWVPFFSLFSLLSHQSRYVFRCLISMSPELPNTLVLASHCSEGLETNMVKKRATCLVQMEMYLLCVIQSFCVMYIILTFDCWILMVLV
jgi:hypothetical protein